MLQQLSKRVHFYNIDPSVYKPYITPWKPGEVYMMEILDVSPEYSQYKGWYIAFYVDRIEGCEFEVRGIFDQCPYIYIMLSSERLQKPDDILTLQCCSSLRFSKEQKRRYHYLFSQRNNRNKPQNLEYVGICDTFQHPEDEYKNDVFTLINWHDFVQESIEGYLFSLESN